MVGRQVREHPHRKFDLRRAVKFQPEARNLHDAGVAAVVGHAAQKQLQIAAFRRCMVQIMPVPGPADAVGAHQPDPPPVGLQNGCQQVGRRRLALRAGHADHRHGAGRFAVEPRGQRRHGTPRVARQQHGTPGGQAGHIMGAEHRRGPGSDGLRRKVVAVGVPPGQTDEQRPGPAQRESQQTDVISVRASPRRSRQPVFWVSRRRSIQHHAPKIAHTRSKSCIRTRSAASSRRRAGAGSTYYAARAGQRTPPLPGG